MLTVATLPRLAAQDADTTPEVISLATDVATVRSHLLADLQISSTPEYTEQVCEWFDTARDTMGMITHPNGDVDVWIFEANQDQLAA